MRDIVFGILLVFLGRTSHMVARAQTTPSSCSAGSWLNSNGSCQGCYAGMYSASGAYACSYCAVGSYSSGYRSSSCTGIYVTITSLEPTYVPPLPCFLPRSHAPCNRLCLCASMIVGPFAACSIGMYAPSPGSFRCSATNVVSNCAYNGYNSKCKKNGDTTTCGTNKVCWGTGSCWSPSDCTSNYCMAGMYQSYGVCDSCNTGMYSGNGMNSCSASCSAGMYASSPASCIDCSTGKYSTASSVSCASTCPAGYYAFVNACIGCAAGTISTSPVSTACSSCPSGKVSASGASTCTASCQTGTYFSGSTSCQACAVGTYSGSTGATACTNCDAGKYSARAASTMCAACAAGQYSALASSVCTMCSAGNFQSSTGATSCGACVAGMFSSAGMPTCGSSCPYGLYSQTGLTSCLTQCSVDTYATIGTYVCLACPSGKFAPQGANTCIPNICANNDFEPTNSLGTSTTSDYYSSCSYTFRSYQNIQLQYGFIESVPQSWTSETCATHVSSSNAKLTIGTYMNYMAGPCCTSGVSACSNYQPPLPNICANNDFTNNAQCSYMVNII